MTRDFKNNVIASLLSSYLKFVYFTTKWQYILPSNYSLDDLNNAKKTIFAFWHNRLAIAPYVFRNHKNMSALVSPHKDGKIISNILYVLGHKVIEGSTNRNPFGAIRSIMADLHDGRNIAITPDGPRGPKYKINSNIIGIARRSGASVVPISLDVTHYFSFSSWDSFIFPLPFGKGIISIGDKLELYENEELSIINLEKELMMLSKEKTLM